MAFGANQQQQTVLSRLVGCFVMFVCLVGHATSAPLPCETQQQERLCSSGGSPLNADLLAEILWKGDVSSRQAADCPWTYEITCDETRRPAVLAEAVCQSGSAALGQRRAADESAVETANGNGNCVQIFYTIPIERRVAETDEWKEDIYSVAVGCTRAQTVNTTTVDAQQAVTDQQDGRSQVAADQTTVHDLPDESSSSAAAETVDNEGSQPTSVDDQTNSSKSPSSLQLPTGAVSSADDGTPSPSSSGVPQDAGASSIAAADSQPPSDPSVDSPKPTVPLSIDGPYYD